MSLVWIAGPHAWESQEEAAAIVGKLAGKFGIGRLMLLVDGDPGFSRHVVMAAHDKGMLVLELKAAYNVWNHEAGRRRDMNIVTVLKPDVLIAVRYFELEGNNHRNVSTAIELAAEYNIPIIRVKVDPDNAIPSAKWARDRQAEKKRRKPAAKRAVK